jgi:hypothetical protein
VVAVTDTITVPPDIPSGVFDLSLAIVDAPPSSPDPIVKLGIKGRDSGGWYPLARIRIDR